MKTKFLSLILAIVATQSVIAQTPTDSGFPNATRRPPKVFTEAVNWNSGVTYAYDGTGNIRSIGSEAQVYDAAGRLVQGTVNGVTWKYTYDAFGNRQTCSAPGTDCQYGMTISRTTNKIDNVSYDATGNVTSLGGRSFTWDAIAVMTRESGNGVTREFVYTADDERIAVYDAGTWRWSVRDPSGKVLRDFTSQDNGASLASANWTWTRDYVYRDGLLVASRQKLAPNTTPVTWHYHLDHLGTPRRITNDADAVVGSHTYYAFGPETPDGLNEPSLTRLKFTGHERDSEAGGGLVELDYMHARYYSAALGRFLSVDPTWASADLAAPQSWNRYVYGKNAPLSYTDPSGRNAVAVAGATLELALDAAAEELLKNGIKSGIAYAVATWLVGPKAETADPDGRPVGDEPPTMLGEDGPKVDSKTLWTQDGARVDVENPNPGRREGQVQFQRGMGNKKETYVIQRVFDQEAKRWGYRIAEPGTGAGAPNWVFRLLTDPAVRAAVLKGMRDYLGEKFFSFERLYR